MADGNPTGARSIWSAACEDSCRALGVERIDLYQLHAPDPRTPLATSVRALAALKRDGRIGAIGLCNVTVGQIEDARRIADIDSIQVELSVWQDAAFLSGVADYCARHRLTLLAHRPLGGRRVPCANDGRPGADRGRGPAWRHAVRDCAGLACGSLAGRSFRCPASRAWRPRGRLRRAQRLELTDEDRRVLDERFPAGRSIRVGTGAATSCRCARMSDAEVVLVMGLPGAGKTTLARRFVADGYQRVNRDEEGGTLRDLVPELDRALDEGRPRIVLDNTYMSRKSRAEVIRAASERGVPARCIWLSTSVDEAQVNAASRLVSRYGRLPDEEELRVLAKARSRAFPPGVQFRCQRELEPPDPSEGFSRIDVVPFERRIDPSHVNRAVIVWCDDVLLRSRSDQRTPIDRDDVAVDGVIARRRCAGIGTKAGACSGLSWQPEIADGTRSSPRRTRCSRGCRNLSSLAIDVEYCPHAAGPPRCWCRKPLPGLGVLLIHRHQLDPAQCIYVGEGSQDPGFARKLGFTYRSRLQSPISRRFGA